MVGERDKEEGGLGNREMSWCYVQYDLTMQRHFNVL